jgi:acyl-[acyl-carrier-protein]-phospholipid O-acyltransferase/long-chain-fatty-acid--[acyl-carrier-protein] ligase
MVSLAAVEELVLRTWPRTRHAVMSVPDPQAGEQLVLLTEHYAATRLALVERARLEGASNLTVPKRVLVVPSIPLLANGKIDYPATRALAEKILTRPQEAAG